MCIYTFLMLLFIVNLTIRSRLYITAVPELVAGHHSQFNGEGNVLKIHYKNF